MSTQYLARFFGVWIVVVQLGMAFNRATTIAAIDGIFSNPGLAWVTGVFTALIGLVVILGHNRWSGSAAAVLVTLFGWIALLKGLTFVWLPIGDQQQFYAALQFERFYYGYLVFGLGLGGFLIYAGFAKDRKL